jgi:glutathione S-transferase
MITLHHLNNSRSQRVLWLLEELGLPYKVAYYKRNALTMLAPPELLAIHPLGKSPVITDGELTVAESGAIVEYLVARYGNGRLIPAADTPERLRYTYWLHYAEGSAMLPLLLKLIFGRVATAPMPFFIKPIARGIVARVNQEFIDPQLKLHFGYIESELGKTGWFAGTEFTAADVQMSFPLEAAAARGGSAGAGPNITAFLQRIHARPAYQAALKQGGAYELLT